MSAQYLIVCYDKREYFDPEILTGCQSFQNIALFPVIGLAMMMLTHHNDANEHDKTLPQNNSITGRWRGGKIFTTGKAHSGDDNTGNNKCGNLYVVAQKRFTDISAIVLDAVKEYSQAEKEPDPPKKEDIPPTIPSEESRPSENDDEEYENVRFRTMWIGGNRTTIIEESRMVNGRKIWVQVSPAL